MTDPKIEEIKRRVAFASIGPSTLRNQGARGVAGIAQQFLMTIDMELLLNIVSEEQYMAWLNKQTNKLKDQFPGKAKGNWGAARKAVNVFMEEAFYNRYLNREYKLDKIVSFLELPVDSYVIKNLKKNIGKYKLPKWRGIKHLTADNNQKYQDRAQKVAQGEGINRVFLDLRWWRSEK